MEYELPHAVMVDDTVVVAGSNGLWVNRNYGSDDWRLVPSAPDVRLDCPTVHDSTLTLIATRSDGSKGMATFDPATETVTVADGLLPETSDTTRFDANYCGSVNVDGVWAVAATDGTSLTFGLSDDQGATFSKRHLELPSELIGETPLRLLSTMTTLLRDGDSLVADLCLGLDYESRCDTAAIEVSTAVVDLAAAEEITVAESTPVLIEPSDEFVGLRGWMYDGASADPRHRKFFAVQDQVWRAELVEVTGSWSDYELEVDDGRWAAGRLGSDLVALPVGYEPEFFAYLDGVVAEVPLGIRPDFGSVDPGDPIETQWWYLAAGSTEWKLLPAPVAVPLRRPIDGGALSLHSLETGPTGTTIRVVPQQWEDVLRISPSSAEFDGEFFVVDDHLYAMGEQGAWRSDDRGATWDHIPSQVWSGFCASASQDEIAFLANDTQVDDDGLQRWHQELRIDSPTGGYRSAELPVAEVDRYSNFLLFACEPLKVDDLWLTARVDLAKAELAVFVVDSANEVSDYRISLNDPIEDFGFPSYSGRVGLYRDNDTVVARVCSPHQGAQCRFADVLLDKTLFDGPSGSIDVEQARADGALQIVSASASEPQAAWGVFQLGDELWRADPGAPTGATTIGGEGASVVDVYDWLGGPMDGPTELVPHGVESAREAAPWTRGQGLYFLFNGNPMTCDGPLADDPECWTLDGGEWRRHLGSIAVDWTTIPAGTEVAFSHRTPTGEIMVIATGQ